MTDYFDRIEQQLVQRVEAGAPSASRLRVPWGGLAAAAVVLVVVVVAGAFLVTLRSGPAQEAGSQSSAGGNSVTLSLPLGTSSATVDRVVSYFASASQRYYRTFMSHDKASVSRSEQHTPRQR